MFVGASAIGAILTRKPEADALADVLKGMHGRRLPRRLRSSRQPWPSHGGW